MRDVEERVEAGLVACFEKFRARTGPPRLWEAMSYAVFPGGSRFRPRLLSMVARAHGDPCPALTDAAAVAIELVHCASLVHDDLPCFDDAAIRRGAPSVHAAFSEATAVLVGDALIIMAFQVLLTCPAPDMAAVARLGAVLADGIGYPSGLVAGQAWEAEPAVPLARYHQAKTASLFRAACEMGAIAAGVGGEGYRRTGELLGAAYQIADDLADGAGSSTLVGKPVRVDQQKARPSAFTAFGADGCRRRIAGFVREAADALPASPDRAAIQEWLLGLGAKLLASAEPPVSGEHAAQRPVGHLDEREAETVESLVRGHKAGRDGALHQRAGER